MTRLFSRQITLVAAVAVGLFFFPGRVQAQYTVRTLTSKQPGTANTDPNLVNAWGLAAGPTSPFWVSDNGTNLSTLYNAQGVPQGLVVVIPSAAGQRAGSPTGIVFNGKNDFVVRKNGLSGPAFFLFATLDGTVSGWNPQLDLTHAVIAADQSASGAMYTGLAIASDINSIYAADAANNKVDAYDGRFNLVTTFTDNDLPPSFAPYGIQVIGKQVFVTFASTGNTPGGMVDIFDEFGNFHKRLITNGVLNQPWGLARAPAGFGPFSNALLVSNNLPNGTINAFNSTTGKFLGTLTGRNGKPLLIDQIWGLEFGGGSPANGRTNQLFFTAGPHNYAQGRFGVIEFSGDQKSKTL